MKLGRYKKLFNQLNTQTDIAKLAAKSSYTQDLLLVIYTQKIVQFATKKFHKIKYLAPKIHSQWRRGSSFLQISQKIEFPPVLTAALILKEEGISRKMFRKYLNNLDTLKDEQLRKELYEVVANDIVYSPEGNEIQAERGRQGEQKINDWLTQHKFEFLTEKEIAEKFDKTPDFLLKNPLNVRGTDVHWIESKATFGNRLEIKKNLKNQLIPYRELFGSGMVIYSFGIITPAPIIEGILIETGDFIQEWKE